MRLCDFWECGEKDLIKYNQDGIIRIFICGVKFQYSMLFNKKCSNYRLLMYGGTIMLHTLFKHANATLLCECKPVCIYKNIYRLHCILASLHAEAPFYLKNVDIQRETKSDESQINGQTEGWSFCLWQKKNPKVSLLFGLILPSAHVGVMKTANTLHVEQRKEYEYRLKWKKEKNWIRSRVGWISFISVSLTVKRDIIREKQSPLHISLSFTTCTLTQPPSQSLSLLLPISEMFLSIWFSPFHAL